MSTIHLHTGDCFDVLQGIESDSVDLIYLDPPFFSQTVQKLSTRDGKTEYSFSDVWDSYSQYAEFVFVRMGQMHRCLKASGSVFFHCNDRSNHIARLLLDEIFGPAMFRSEIVWTYRRWSNAQKGLLPAHQTIYFYSKTSNFKFNQICVDYSASTNIDQILQRRQRDSRGKAVYARDESGEAISNGAKKGVPLSDVWEIPFLNPKARERVGYPTQKPVLLLDRILSLCTDPGDTVLDPFCGSGTTLVAAKLSGRKGIGIDCSPDAIHLAQSRVDDPVATRSRLLEVGKEEYIREDLHLLDVLKGVDFYPVQRNKGIDAILKEECDGQPVLIRIQRKGEVLWQAANSLIQASKKKGRSRLIVIATDEGQDSLIDHHFLGEDIIVVKSIAMALKEAMQVLPSPLRQSTAVPSAVTKSIGTIHPDTKSA